MELPLVVLIPLITHLSASCHLSHFFLSIRLDVANCQSKWRASETVRGKRLWSFSRLHGCISFLIESNVTRNLRSVSPRSDLRESRNWNRHRNWTSEKFALRRAQSKSDVALEFFETEPGGEPWFPGVDSRGRANNDPSVGRFLAIRKSYLQITASFSCTHTSIIGWYFFSHTHSQSKLLIPTCRKRHY